MSQEEDTRVGLAEPVTAPQAFAFIKSAPYFVVLLDRRYRFRWWNRLDPTLRPEDVLGQPVTLFIQEDARPQAMAAIDECFATGKATRYDVMGYADGELKSHYVNHVLPVPPGPDGDARVCQLVIDVTRHADVRDELSRSEERFRLLTESSPDFISVVNQERTIVFNNRAPRAANHVDNAVSQWRIDELTHPDDVSAAIAAIDTVFRENKPSSYEARDPSDNHIYAVRVLPLPPEDDKPRALLISTDVTEHRRAEQQRLEMEARLQAAQKMELVGQLAGGVAHDFNNLLLVIMNQVDFLEHALVSGGDAKAEIPQLRAATDRAAELVKQLLTFGRRQPMRVEQVKLSKVIDRAMPLLRRAVPESIELVRTIVTDGWIQADAAQLEQVLLNLCVNARDAMQRGGRITFEQTAVTRDGVACLALSVTDTGSGIEPENLARIFEPYFTTKAVGEGSGLGLAMVHGIITRHDGFIDVRSDEGLGTTFTITLPESSARSESDPVGPSRQAAHARGEGTILVAEDQPAVRQIVRRLLEDAGYRVVEVGDGLQAVEYLADPGAEVDLVLLDAVMPKLNGGDAYLRMRELRPGLKAVFTSGYAADALPTDLLERESIRLIPKPFAPGVLLEAIRATLEA